MFMSLKLACISPASDFLNTFFPCVYIFTRFRFIVLFDVDTLYCYITYCAHCSLNVTMFCTYRVGVIQDFEVEGGNKHFAKKRSTVISIPCYSM